MPTSAANVNREPETVPDITSRPVTASLSVVTDAPSRGRGSSRSRPSDRPGAESESRAERKERTRQALLDVTLKLVTNRSLASISLREVARDAGIVPTAFYRHFDSMDTLGIELVDESMRPLRQLIRDARKGRNASGDIIKDTVTILGEQVRAHPAQFQFLTRERYGGIAGVRRAIDTELRLFTSELTVDLARLTEGFSWSTDDLEMTAQLMVAAMLTTVMDLLEVDPRRLATETATIMDRAERQLRLIALGMSRWRSAD